MPLIACPICTKDVSAVAPACPNCGHPISKGASKPSRPVVTGTGLFSATVSVLFLLVVFATIIAAVSKPNESALRNALIEKYGLIYGAGVVAEKLGLLNVQYHDYIVFSRLSVEIPFDSERTVAYGIYGKTIVPDGPVSFGSNERQTSRPTEPINNGTIQMQPAFNENPPVQPPPPPPKQRSMPNVVEQPQYSEQQLRQGLQLARQTLISTEMRDKASSVLSDRHPFSRIEQCNDPNIQSFNTSLYGEEIVGVYTCRMRGTITGKNTFIVTVRVKGAITFQNGTFIRQVVDANVIADSKEN